MKTIIKEINWRELRKRMGLTLEEMAGRCDLTPANLSQFERGLSNSYGLRIRYFLYAYFAGVLNDEEIFIIKKHLKLDGFDFLDGGED